MYTPGEKAGVNGVLRAVKEWPIDSLFDARTHSAFGFEIVFRFAKASMRPLSVSIAEMRTHDAPFDLRLTIRSDMPVSDTTGTLNYLELLVAAQEGTCRFDAARWNDFVTHRDSLDAGVAPYNHEVFGLLRKAYKLLFEEDPKTSGTVKIQELNVIARLNSYLNMVLEYYDGNADMSIDPLDGVQLELAEKFRSPLILAAQNTSRI